MIQWLHPTIVHFPIALLFAGLLFDVLGLARINERLLFAGFWSTMLGVLAVVAATLSGFYSQAHLGPHSSVGNALLGFHKAFALVVLFAASILAAWRLAMRGYIQPRVRTLYVAASLFCAAFVFITGLFGGGLVYLYGLGIPPQAARRVLEAQPLPPTRPAAADAAASGDRDRP